VLVEHVDDVLREALVIPDPIAVFGLPRNVLEYRGGELVAPIEAADVVPAAAAAGQPGEQPGA
jgi:ATP-dependent Lon protease